MGIELLTEEQYRELQKLGNFDTKTSSWVKAPAAIRKLGGALFGDRRFGHVFVYHNGAQSYYGTRAFPWLAAGLNWTLNFEPGVIASESARVSKHSSIRQALNRTLPCSVLGPFGWFSYSDS